MYIYIYIYMVTYLAKCVYMCANVYTLSRRFVLQSSFHFFFEIVGCV